MARLQTVESGDPIPAGAGDSSPFQKVQTGCAAHQV
jgi:hypothetical protein